MNKLVSVIIPAYNAAGTIERAVRSVLSQSFSTIEVLVVNDGSSDNTLAILENLAKEDSRVVVIDKPNGGVSSARNAALAVAKGAYVAFVDSDDWVGEQYVEHMLSEMDDETGLVISSSILHDCNGERVVPGYARVAGDGKFDALFDGTNLARRTSPWSKLYRMDVVREKDMRFPEKIHMGEDACFFFSYLLYVDRVVMVDAADYHYYYAQAGSLTKKVNSFASENLAYSTIASLINRLETEKGIDSSESVQSLRATLCDYQRRALNAAYKDVSLSRKDRISFVSNEEWSTYVNHYCEDGSRGKIKAFLLKNHYCKLYDIIRNI